MYLLFLIIFNNIKNNKITIEFITIICFVRVGYIIVDLSLQWMSIVLTN